MGSPLKTDSEHIYRHQSPKQAKHPSFISRSEIQCGASKSFLEAKKEGRYSVSCVLLDECCNDNGQCNLCPRAGSTQHALPGLCLECDTKPYGECVCMDYYGNDIPDVQ